MATITPVREDLDPYFTVTWSSINPGDNCVPFDGLHATLEAAQCVTPGGVGENIILVGSNENTFTPAGTSTIIGSMPAPGIGQPPFTKVRWFAPFVSPSLTQPAITAILLFKVDA